jgi:predicted Zn-dependent peptidase
MSPSFSASAVSVESAATMPEARPSQTAPRNIRRTVLPNGLLVLTESMPHVRSVSMGVWVNSGSRDETAPLNGMSHFVEHMVFKGTTSRSAQQIAREVDTIGGNLDAFTGKETICFNIKVLDENLTPALDVLTDLVLNPTFTPEDLTREQGVILEEIKMDEDNPDYLVHEVFTQNFWKNDALGRPILGTAETVSSFDQGAVFDYYRGQFTPENMVFSAAGNLEHDEFVDRVARQFEALKAAPGPLVKMAASDATPHITLKRKRSLEQVQVCLGVPAPPVNDAQRYGVYLLNTMLGGGMSSRLFQNIRERQGLAYAVFSELNPYSDTGCLSVYAGTSLESAKKVVESVLKEFTDLKQQLAPAEEVRRAKDHLKGSLMLSLESTSSRMSNLARQEMHFRRFFTLDELAESIEQVTAEDVQRVARTFFDQKNVALTVLGNLDGFKIVREDLTC